MLNLFNRRITIEAGHLGSTGIKVENLRVVFNIKKVSTDKFNTGKVEIYGMNKNSNDQLQNLNLDDPKNLLIVRAGYEGQQSMIFVGSISYINVNPKKPEVITTIDANDGEKVTNQLRVPCAQFNGTYSGHVDAKKVLRDLVNASGLETRHIDWSNIPSRNYVSGFCFVGMGKVLLNNLCSYLGVEYSIQNNQLKLINVGESDTVKIVELTSETGLIGSPEKLTDVLLDNFKMDKKAKKKKKVHTAGWKITALLQPTIEPGNVVRVQSLEIPTLTDFRVVEVIHIGDTHGNDWKTEMNVKAL